MKPHLVHLTQAQSLATELAAHLKRDPAAGGGGGEVEGADARAIRDILSETLVSTVYVQYSAMAPRLGEASSTARSVLEKETTVVWSFAGAAKRDAH